MQLMQLTRMGPGDGERNFKPCVNFSELELSNNFCMATKENMI